MFCIFLHVRHVHCKHVVTGNIWLGSELEGEWAGACVARSHLSYTGCCWAVNVGRLPVKPRCLISVSTPVRYRDGTRECGGFVQLFKVNFVSPGKSDKKQCNLLLFCCRVITRPGTDNRTTANTASTLHILSTFSENWSAKGFHKWEWKETRDQSTGTDGCYKKRGEEGGWRSPGGGGEDGDTRRQYKKGSEKRANGSRGLHPDK